MANEVKLFGYYTMGNKQVWVADIANDQVFFENCDERPIARVLSVDDFLERTKFHHIASEA